MSSLCGLCHPGRLAMIVTAALLSVGVANAQITGSHDSSSTEGTSAAPAADSSSTAYSFIAEPADPAPAAKPAFSAAGQYDNKSKAGADWKGKLALEFGGGFDPP